MWRGVGVQVGRSHGEEYVMHQGYVQDCLISPIVDTTTGGSTRLLSACTLVGALRQIHTLKNPKKNKLE